MTIEQNKKLVERYPFLLPRNVFTDELEEDYDYSYIFPLEIPKGWFELFLQLCEDIRQPLIEANYLTKFRLSQVKEKYNRLDVYHQGVPEAASIVDDIISKYSMMASFVCSVCGKPATFETSAGWIISYCDDCWKDRARHEKGTWLKFKPEFIVRWWANNGWEERIVSFKDEWDRYIKTWRAK